MENIFHLRLDLNTACFFRKNLGDVANQNQFDYEFLQLQPSRMGIHTQYPMLLLRNGPIRSRRVDEIVAYFH